MQKLFQAGQQMVRPQSLVRNPTFRKFSTGQVKPPSSSGIGFAQMAMMGASIAGFTYIGY